MNDKKEVGRIKSEQQEDFLVYVFSHNFDVFLYVNK